MKRLICILLALLMLGSWALAEGDLQSMTFDELIELRNQITKEITSRPEWKQVTVPEGVYQIGVDIPAGHWTISIEKGTAQIHYGSDLNESKTDVSGWIFGAAIVDPDDQYNSDRFNSSVSIQLSDDNWLIVTGKPVIFTPYIRPSLDF